MLEKKYQNPSTTCLLSNTKRENQHFQKIKNNTKMKNFIKNSIATLIAFFFLSIHLNAQCSDIYFYRFNGFQSEKPVYLSQDGERIATVRLGDRYKATVCSPGQYEFVVKTNEDNFSVIKTSLDVGPGKEYYIKIGCTIGVEVATIAKKSKSKGSKDWGKGSKFKSAVKDLNLKNVQVAAGGGSQGGGSSSTFQKTQIVNNFKFEIVGIVRAGSVAQFQYKITNLADHDRKLKMSSACTTFYDELGNIVTANDYCITGKCNGSTEYRFDGDTDKIKSHLQNQYRRGIEKVMPSGIPLNATFSFNEISKKATMFVRGSIWFLSDGSGSYSDPMFELPYSNIVFPNEVDANNPFKRNIGAISVELISTIGDGNGVMFHFKANNSSADPYELGIEGGILWDDMGNEYKIDAFSFVIQDQMNEIYHQKRKSMINRNEAIDIYLQSRDVSPKAREIKRATIQFTGFEFSWENIKIELIAGNKSIGHSDDRINKPPTASYIRYDDFETKIRNNENLVGKKIILENIYFTSGNDEILSTSYSQLDRLVNVMANNTNLKVEVSGHTDNVGEDIPNMLLSQKRADSIRYYLIGKSIDPSRITSLGKGARQAIADNNSDGGRQQNRRVEIQIVE
ncbi:MAG: outer membrane protein OmpA-like peptidoglycan-associated protein [Ulvibacter sp.]